MGMNQPRGPGRPAGPDRQPYPGPLYPGSRQPNYCPYGGTSYSPSANIDVPTLARQLNVSVATLLDYNPGLSIAATVYGGQIVCLPESR